MKTLCIILILLATGLLASVILPVPLGDREETVSVPASMTTDPGDAAEPFGRDPGAAGARAAAEETLGAAPRRGEGTRASGTARARLPEPSAGEKAPDAVPGLLEDLEAAFVAGQSAEMKALHARIRALGEKALGDLASCIRSAKDATTVLLAMDALAGLRAAHPGSSAIEAAYETAVFPRAKAILESVEDPALRAHAAFHLAACRLPAGVDVLLERVRQDREERVRAACLDALVREKERGATPALVNMLELGLPHEERSRLGIARASLALLDESSRARGRRRIHAAMKDDLEAILQDPAPQNAARRYAAFHLLLQTAPGGDARTLVEAVRRETNPFVFAGVVDTLVDRKETEDLAPVLEEIACDVSRPEGVKRLARGALSRIRGR